MDFFKSKAGLLLVLIILVLIGTILWTMLWGNGSSSSPEGTLVYVPRQEVIL